MIELFPASSLDNSILTSVLVGLMVVWFLQETLGWGFTALVVPGYLASILVIQPLTGAVVVLEVVLTYLVLVGFSQAVPRWWPWFPLFGRDRFFFVLVASVAVRLVLEGAAFPLITDTVGVTLGDELHSMGLVVVPLAAHALWRPGLLAGLPRIGVPVVVTWAFLEFVLLEYTNLSLSSFELTYEDLARDFVSSPRAYILLLGGAWLGSRANLLWGWDFGGIIVPGLLALCWLQPERLAATLGEVVVITMVIRLVLKLPVLRHANLSGGRPLVLAFAGAYLIKFLLGVFAGSWWPGLEVRALFGFGYLLPALIALRAVRSGDLARTLVPSVTTSLVAFLGASALGYLLAVVLPSELVPDTVPAEGRMQDGGLRVAAAAWLDQGAAPSGIERALGADEEQVIAGGNGFGGLWLRPGGAPLVLTATAGAPQMVEAAVRLTEVLDLQALLICAHAGATCDTARDELATRLPVVLLVDGDDAVLEARGSVAAALDLQALGRLLPSLHLEPASAASVLRVPLAQRLSFSQAGVTPAPVLSSPVRSDLLPAALAPVSQAELVALSRLVVPALDAWRRGGEDADDALAGAAGWARRLGLVVQAQDGVAAVIGRDWHLMVRQDTGPQSTPRMVVVPRAGDEADVASFGLAMWQSGLAQVLLVDAPPPDRGHGAREAREAHVMALSWLEALGAGVQVVELRAAPDGRDPGGGAVVTVRQPLDRSAALPASARWALELMSSAGADPVVYDGSARRRAFADPDNPLRAATRAATGKRAHVTVFLGRRLRARVAPIEPDHPLARLAPALPQRQVDLATLLSTAGARTPDAELAPLRAAIDVLAASPRPAHLAAVERAAAADGRETLLLCDALAGCRWLLFERCDGPRCDAVLSPIQARSRLVPGLTPSQAVLVGGADVQLTLPGAAP